MVSDHQARLLMTLIGKGKRIGAAAAGAGMCEKTARKYRKLGRLPSECRAEHTWRTRDDAFVEVWPELEAVLAVSPGLQA